MKLPVYNPIGVQSLGREDVYGPIKIANARTQALGELSRQVGNFGAQMKRQQEEAEREAEKQKLAADRVEGIKTVTDGGLVFDDMWNQRLEEGGPNLRSDAGKMWSQYESEMVKRVPDSQKQSTQIALARQKAQMFGNLADYERTEAKKRQVRDVGETVEISANALLNNPNNYDGLREKNLAAIEAMEIPDDQKARIRATAENHLARSYMEGRIDEDPQAALNELKSGDLDARFQGVEKRTQMRAAQNEIDRRKAEAERAAALAERAAEKERVRNANAVKGDIKAHVAGIENEGVGVEGLDERAEQYLTEGEYAAYKKAATDAQEFYVAKESIVSVPATELPVALAKYQPEPGSRDYDTDLRRYQRLEQAAATEMKLRIERPADAAARSPDVQESFATMMEVAQSDADPSVKRAATSDYVQTITGEQLRLGVPETRTRLLTEAMKGNLVASLTEGTAQDRADVLMQNQDLWGSNWGQVFGELGDDVPPETMTLGLMNAPGDNGLRVEYVEAMDTGAKAYKDIVGTDNSREVEDTLTGEMEEINATIRAKPGGDTQIQGLRKSVELLALKYTADGEDPSTAARRAYDAIIGDRYEFFGTYRVPVSPDIDPEAVTDGALELLDDIYARQDILTPPSLTGLDQQFARPAAIESLRQSGYWGTSGDETGLVLFWQGGRPVQVMGGGPLKVTWEELTTAAAGATAPPVETEIVP